MVVAVEKVLLDSLTYRTTFLNWAEWQKDQHNVHLLRMSEFGVVVLFSDTLVAVRTFSVMYDHTLFPCL